jgi:hypothetical protein
MSSPAIVTAFPRTLRRDAQAAVSRDAEAVPARPVYFKVARRLDVQLLNRLQRLGYEYFCRTLRYRWRVPPVVPMERGGLMTFGDADGECDSPDDQILVLPFGWTYRGDSLDEEITCRPRDPADRERYERLKARYATYSLAAYVSPALAAENVELKSRLKEHERLDACAGGLVADIEDCREIVRQLRT